VVEADGGLVKYMKKWRWDLSKKRGVPPFIIMNDVTLLDLCNKVPASLRELLQITGIGERKAELYGAEILDALAKWDRTQPVPYPKGVRD